MEYAPLRLVSVISTTLDDLDNANQDVYDYIIKNHSEQGRVILFGYSYGGVLATHLEERLKNTKIKVNLLVTLYSACYQGKLH